MRQGMLGRLASGLIIALLAIAAARGDAPAPPLPPLTDYEGVYRLTPETDLKIFLRGGNLYAESKYQSAAVLTRISRDNFVAEAVSASFDFERDAQGRVVEVTMDQAEKVFRALRR